MSTVRPPKEVKFKESPPFQYYNYSTIDEAEARSGNIGFPIFSSQWLDDGSVLLGGGGGSRGRDVRSALVTCRLVDGVAVDSFLPQQALIDPLALSTAQVSVPSLPMIQAVGEITTADAIVSSISNSANNVGGLGNSILAAGAGACSIVFEIKGFGSLASSQLPPCRDLNQPNSNLDYYRAVQQQTLMTNTLAAQKFTQPTLPFSTPFKSPLLSHTLSLSSISSVNGSSAFPPSLPSSVSTNSTALTNISTQNPSQNNTSSLQKVISQLTKEGKRTMMPKLRFRCDFSPRDSFVSAIKFSRDGKLCFTGGQDGVVRVWWVQDPALFSTYVTYGVKLTPSDNNSNVNLGDGTNWFSNHKKSAGAMPKMLGVPLTPDHHKDNNHNNNNHNNHHHQPRITTKDDGSNGKPQLEPLDMTSARALGFVSPLFIPVAFRKDGIKDFDLSHDERLLSLVDDKGGLSTWVVPDLNDVQTRGIRIPIDYLDEEGELLSYPAPNDKVNADDVDLSASLSAAFQGVDEISPICMAPSHPGLDYQRSLFWAPPVVNYTVPRSGNPGELFGSIGIFDDYDGNNGGSYGGKNNNIGKNNSEINDYDDENHNYDENLVRPHNLSDLLQTFNNHPSRNLKEYILLSLASEVRKSTWLIKHVVYFDERTKQHQIRVSSQLKIFDNPSGSQMVISPNKHFVAIAGDDLHIYTTLDAPYIRTLQLLALNQSYSYQLSNLGPLALVAKKERCFSLPCTSLTFDPSSRILLAGSASRAIVFLRVRPMPIVPFCNSTLLFMKKWLCPLYYITCLPLCCNPRYIKQFDEPPPRPNKCLAKLNNLFSWIVFLLFFGWLFAGIRKVGALCGKGKDGGFNSSSNIKLPGNTNDDGNAVISSGGLTIVNLFIFGLVAVFLAQFLAEFGPQ
jgi:hypothetical protein